MWIKAKNEEERLTIYKKNKELNFSGTSGFHILSNANYFYVDLDKKTFHIGCRYPSMLKSEDVISYEEFLSLI